MIHATAAACFLTTLTGFYATALAALIIALGSVSAWERALLRGKDSPRAIEMPPSGPALVVLASGKAIAVRAVRGVGVTRYWVALASCSFKDRSLMVTTGMLGTESARLLRLWALWGRTVGVVSAQRPEPQ